MADATYPPRGLYVKKYEEKGFIYERYTDGSGGFEDKLVDSIHPVRGSLLSSRCMDKNLYGIYADGGGNTFEAMIEKNSHQCGAEVKTSEETIKTFEYLTKKVG